MRSYDNSYNENVNRTRRGRKSKKQSNFLFGDFIARNPFNRYLFFLIMGLAALGLIMILSSSYYKSVQTFGNGFFYFKKQLVVFFVGTAAMLIASKINYNFVKKYLAPCLYWLGIGLMIYVFIKGQVFKGANRWIEIFGFNFQPSEFMKVVMCLYLALILSNRKESDDTAKKGMTYWQRVGNSIKSYKREIIYILIPTCLIFVENWSTAIVVFLTGAIIIGLDGFKIDTWFLALIMIVLLVILLAKTGGLAKIRELDLFDGKYNKRIERLEVWLDPFSDPLGVGYQTVQSLYGIGAGGITGVGIGKSKQKLGYVPEAYNDMIFTIICEEFGLIGATIILGLFIALIVECCKVALNAPDKFSKYYTAGIITYIFLQVAVNVGVATGVFPNTGMPLPFISYGGSGLLMTMTGMGIILSITRYED